MSAATMLPWIYWLLRWLISGLFLAAGWNKLLDLHAFALTINDYGLLPEALVLPVAVFLVAGEIILGLGLLVDLRGSLAGITLFLLLFIAVLSYGIHLGLDVDCGCFGPEDTGHVYQGLWQALYRDMAMLTGIIFLYWYRYRFSVAPRNLLSICLLFRKGETA